jgi:hypothetical protein
MNQASVARRVVACAKTGNKPGLALPAGGQRAVDRGTVNGDRLRSDDAVPVQERGGRSLDVERA